MNEAPHTRIDDLRLRIAQWERVHDHEVRGYKDDNFRFQQAVSKSSAIVLMASVPSVAWTVLWSLTVTVGQPAVTRLLLPVFALLILAITSSGAARASALLSHFWFRQNSARERMATTFVPLFAAMFVFGWVIMLLRW